MIALIREVRRYCRVTTLRALLWLVRRLMAAAERLAQFATLKAEASATACKPPLLTAHEFLARAEEFYRAYRDLPVGLPPSWPRYFMLCHSIELALKAYLAANGVSTSRLGKKFGHDLKKLLAKAVESGLPLGEPARSEIERLNEAHEKFWHRYPIEDCTRVFVVDQFELYADELFGHVTKGVRAGARQS